MIIVITSPRFFPDETTLCNLLFEKGLQRLHLRKPGASEKEYIRFLKLIRPEYYSKIVVHEHYHLAKRYKLHGIHLKSNMAQDAGLYSDIPSISISCHSLDEIKKLSFQPSYCFLSPIFNSISKPGYSGYNTIPDLKTEISLPPVIALGGITPSRIALCRQKGFQGVASLGYIWTKPQETLQRFRQLTTPEVMSIAGFDPSSGAGINADLKTFEACGAYGLGAVSSITFQNEKQYSGQQWTPLETICRQCDVLLNSHTPACIKIGLTESFNTLNALLKYLIHKLPQTKIIWDPILKASAGYIFHSSYKSLHQILRHIHLITPNTEELKELFGTTDLKTLQQICQKTHCNILWKGGHSQTSLSTDYLITPEAYYPYSVHRSVYDKHGTGCILSAALTAFMAQGSDLPSACHKAQLYVSNAINSSTHPLVYHYKNISDFSVKPSPAQLRIQYLTDPQKEMSISEQVEAVCRGGIRWIQLRLKEASDEEFLTIGKQVKAICQYYKALLIINDRPCLARELDADGVHLGKEDMSPLEARKIIGKNKIIGATCNTFEDICLRATQNVNYIGLGPFRFTTTKKKLSPVLGIEGYNIILKNMKQRGIQLPVFAIGGITSSDIPSLLQTGIQGIAVSGTIKNSPDLTRKTREILSQINNFQ